jgi:ribosomal protein S18 acetylase RimI-like enzyme
MTIEIRPASGFEDLRRWVEARNEVVPDDPDHPTMMALVRATEVEHVNLLAVEDGEVVGTGMLGGDPNSLESDHPYVEVIVPERHRGRGIGSALLAELSEHVRRLGKHGLHVDAREGDAYSIAFLERRGFVEQEYPAEHLVLDLAGVEPDGARPPDGVSIHSIADRADLIASAFDVAAVTYPELGGPISKQARTLAEWQLYELTDPQIALELTPIAVAGGQAVGFGALRRIDDGPVGVHRITVVHPAWRRRGVGSAMTRMQIAAAKEASYERLEAWVWTDLQQRLYASLGYQRVGASIDFLGPLQ